MTSAELRQLERDLIRDEDLRLRPYVDSVGKITIGVGRNLTDVGLAAAEAMFLLRNDLGQVEAFLESTFPWFAQLSPIRQRALMNMTFNLGVRGLAGFQRMLGAIARGDYDTAAAEMLNSRWAAQVGPRARRLAAMMATDREEPLNA